MTRLVPLALGGALACGSPAGGRRGEVRVPVETAEVTREAIEERRVFTATLESTERFDAIARVGGRVETLEVGLGDVVEHGQVLARLIDAELDADRLASDADRWSAVATRAAAETARGAARRELERVESLHARGALPANALQDARDALATAEARLRAAEGAARRASAELQRSQARSGYAEVTAHWTSTDRERVVAAVHVQQGQVVAPGAPLVTLVDLDPIRAVVSVVERDRARLEIGQTAWIATDGRSEAPIEGSVSRIAPVFDESSRQARVEIDVPNPDGVLAPGAFASASVRIARAEDAVVVPLAALAERDGQTVVFVVDGEIAREVPVAVGVRARERVQLLTEIDGPVVTVGHQALTDGAKVRVVAP